MSKTLITGGAGFIGSHIVELFLKKGHFVRILDNFSTGKKSNIAFLKHYPKSQHAVIKGDIRSPKTCQQACTGMGYVVHQAACKTVPKSIIDPHLFNEVNINGTLNLLQASVTCRIKRFVFASSSSVYGDSKTFPQRETHVPEPISPYGVTKLAGERYCKVFSHLYGLETVCLRYFNVFGPRQPFNDTYSAVIVKFIDHFLNKKSPPVFGTGKQSRDFTYIDNVVSANYLAATQAGIKHDIFNAATGQEHSILDLIKNLNTLTQQKLKPKFLPLRKGDIVRSLSDIACIKKKLHYKPLVSFEQGLKRLVASLEQERS